MSGAEGAGAAAAAAEPCRGGNAAQQWLDAWRALRGRRERARTGRYAVEGARFLLAAMRARVRIESLAYAPVMCTPQTMRVVSQARRTGVRAVRLTPQQFRRGSNAGEPTGVAAVVAQRWGALVRPARGDVGLWLAVGQVRSAGNLGTMMRTAAAVGARGVVLLDDDTDPFDPVTVRASMGAVLGVPLVRTTPAGLAAWSRRARALVVGTSAQARREHDRLPTGRSLVVMMGCERNGMSQAQRRVCDLTVRIPMAPGTSSLNVAVASGVLLFAARAAALAEQSTRRPPSRRSGRHSAPRSRPAGR